MTPTLTSFLAQERRHAWQWGVKDCTMWVADWVKFRTGLDPAESYRGRYSDADSAHALIASEGGFVPLIGWRMDELGFERTQAPMLGDVGIVNVPFRLSDRMPVVQTIAAVRHINTWAMRMAPRGFHLEEVPMVTAWSIP